MLGEFMSIRKNEVSLILVDKEEIWKGISLPPTLSRLLTVRLKENVVQCLTPYLVKTVMQKHWSSNEDSIS